MNENNEMNQLIGTRLKKIRTIKNLSLDELATQTGVSKPMLGKIERGLSNPTVSTLWKIAKGLGLPFSFFIEEEQEEVRIVKRIDVKSLTNHDGGYEVFPLFAKGAFKPFEIYSARLKVGHSYQAEAHSIGVEEFIMVEQGQLQVEVKEKSYSVRQGEAIHFKADREHRYVARGEVDCEMTMVIYYPSV